ncbi:hypothetical protein PX52LOC_03980 [Limnoglobus roseus]|uniref:Uncharacterized protein n=1 Tax=Limnoglobus roseus TaxID=2598579 RepID=A0A5C1AIQ9_9BACT|nr:hypothetical protein PX52LOC_03980 [Limnoglobus roseus]
MSVEVQWTDTDPDTGERRFVSAEKFARKWAFKVRFKRRDNWTKHVRYTREMWETLLDGLERRYRRREGVKEEDLVEVRKILAEMPADDQPAEEA